MSKKRVVGNNFNTGFVGNQVTGIKGTNIFAIGTAFTVQTNLDDKISRDLSSTIGGFSEPISLENLKIGEQVSQARALVENTASMALNRDKSKITNYGLFGSLFEYMRVSIENIIQKFPASLYITNNVNGENKISVLNYAYDNNSDTTTFKIPVICVVNKYNLFYSKNSTVFGSSESLKDLSSNYQKYVIHEAGLAKEFPVLEFEGNTDTNPYLTLKVKGNPFPSAAGGTLATKYHIKPNFLIYEEFHKSLEDFESYLLNRDTTPMYTAVFQEPVEVDEAVVYYEKSFTWTTSDGYNLDIDGSLYESYLKNLLGIADVYDNYKTNLVSRFLTADAIKEFDTPDSKVNNLLRIYGREFDEVKKFIDGLAYSTKLSYDKKENISDNLVKNLAKTLGWGVFTSMSDDNLVKNFLGGNDIPMFSGTSKNMTPAEVDIELWRRLVMNSAYLFKSKGTRKAIEFLFRIIGAPSYLVNFNEYVYVADKKVDINSISVEDQLTLPVDEEGYPTTIENSNDYYFQMKGGWKNKVEVAPSNKNDMSPIGVHFGDYDGGAEYYNLHRQAGFVLHKTVDNKKSWVRSGTTRLDDIYTNYTVEDSRLVLNSKEIDIYLDPANAIEYSVYTYNRDNNFVINPTALPYPYPNTSLTRNDISTKSFVEYLDIVYKNYINTKNRKVVSDNHGGGYPLLRKLYEDFYNISPNNKVSYESVAKYLERIDGFWVDLVGQFIPSTSIWNGGKKIRNTVFDRQKIAYKHGINDGSEFQTNQPDTGASDANTGITVFAIYGSINLGYHGEVADVAKIESSYESSLQLQEPSKNVLLDNILRIKEFATGQTISFGHPDFYMTNASKIKQGLTGDVVHNISIAPVKTLGFTFTGNTSGLGASSGNTTNFRYRLYKYDDTVKVFDNSYFYTHLTTNEFVGQSGSTKTFMDNIEYNLQEGEYLIKPSYLFTFDVRPDTDEHGYHFNSPAGISYDTESLNDVTQYPYGKYDDLFDWYFVIVSNPPKPVINTSEFAEDGSTTVLNLLTNQKMIVNSEDMTLFYLNDVPLGDVIVVFNGSSLLKSDTFDFSDNGEYYIQPSILGGVNIYLRKPAYASRQDTLSLIYVKGISGNDGLKSENQIVGTIPSGTTAGIGAKLFFNTSTNKYEYYFDRPINEGGQGNGINNLIITLGGEILTVGDDYYRSSTDTYRIIFSGIIRAGDVLNIYYTTATNDLFLTSKNFTAKWSAPIVKDSGLFTAEVTLASDTNFTSPIISGTTAYVSGILNQTKEYTLPLGIISGANQTYIYRVKSDKYYKTISGDTITTSVYSDVIKFSTDNRVSTY